MRLPNPLLLPTRLHRAGETELVVSRGLGVTGIPWRAACPPEAVWLTLRRVAPPG